MDLNANIISYNCAVENTFNNNIISSGLKESYTYKLQYIILYTYYICLRCSLPCNIIKFPWQTLGKVFG